MNDRKARVIQALRTHLELCSLSDLYPEALGNGRNDVSNLIKEHWHIDRTWQNHGRGAHKHYALVHEGDRKCAVCDPSPKQLSWVAA